MMAISGWAFPVGPGFYCCSHIGLLWHAGFWLHGGRRNQFQQQWHWAWHSRCSSWCRPRHVPVLLWGLPFSPCSDDEIEKVERVREAPLSLVALYLCRLMISRMAWWTSARSFKSSRCVCLWSQCHFLLWACWREDAPLCACVILSFYNTFNYCICVGCEWGNQKCDQSCSYERFVSFCDLVHQ